MDKIGTNKPKTNKKLVVIFSAVIFVFIVGGFIVQLKDTPSMTNVAPTSPEKKADTSDLDLSVRAGTFTLMVKNNESNKLSNCEVQVNPGLTHTGFNTRVDLMPGKQENIMYRNLTKGSERFNNEDMAIESVVVTHCKNQADRIGIFTFE